MDNCIRYPHILKIHKKVAYILEISRVPHGPWVPPPLSKSCRKGNRASFLINVHHPHELQFDFNVDLKMCFVWDWRDLSAIGIITK